MVNIVWDHGFKRAYEKRIRNDENLKKKFWKSVKSFSADPFSRQLRTHKLTGKLQGLWAFSVETNVRVIFSFLKEDEVLFIDIGSHEEVY
jgi:toxin HigB-1